MCDTTIHTELMNIDQSICLFCDQLLIKDNEETIQCCIEQNIENVNSFNICINCGLVHSYNFDSEYIDFYDNMYKIHRKSIYQRKYHIENILNDLLIDQKVELSHNQRARVYKVFYEIGEILHKVNGNRKRMISTKFIMRKILDMMGLPCDEIPISRSKRTLIYNEKYFSTIMSLIGDKIQSIIVS